MPDINQTVTAAGSARVAAPIAGDTSAADRDPVADPSATDHTQHKDRSQNGRFRPGNPRTADPDEIVENARLLAPRLRERMFETERLRRLPDETISEAAEAGIISLLLPRSLGGAGGGMRHFAEMIRWLAHGHLSATWVLAFLAEHNYMLARYPIETQKEVFKDGRYALMAGVISPTGTARPVAGGYIVNGTWAYASSIMHSDWVMVFVSVVGSDGESRTVLLPREDVEVEETWNMSGMGGTGSHHVHVTEQFVPDRRALELNVWAGRHNLGASIHPEPTYTYALRDMLGVMYPAMAVGAAEVLLEEYRERLDTRRIPMTGLLGADTTMGQVRYARALSALQLAQATLHETIERTVAANASTRETLPSELRARIKLGMLGVLRMAAEAVNLIAEGSGSSIYQNDDHTQQYMRDIEIMRSHLTINEDTMLAICGEILLGRSDAADGAVI